MNRYPSDEELNALIEELEQQELYAPKNLKAQILEQAFGEPARQQPQAAKRKAVHRSVQMFSYSVKVIAGMAAAIIMLVMIPVQNGQAKEADRITLREQQRIEEFQKREEERQKKEKRSAALKESKGALEQKVEEVLGIFDGLWTQEMEEN